MKKLSIQKEAIEKVYKDMGNRNFNRDIKKLLKNYDSSLYGKYNKLHKILIAFNDDSIEFGRFDTIDTKYFKEQLVATLFYYFHIHK